MSKKKIKFKPEILMAILRCFRLLDSSDQQWLIDRLADDWWKQKQKAKRLR